MYLVTGASSGIGRAVTMSLAERNVQVIAVARTESALVSLRESFPQNIISVVADLGTPHGIAETVKHVPHGVALQGLVHSAASCIQPEPYLDIDVASLVGHFQVHVASLISLCQTLSPLQTPRRMLVIDSYSATTPREEWAAYSIIKAAAQMSARCAAQELPGTKLIRVLPGAVNTRFVDVVIDSPAKAGAIYAQMRANGEVAEPSDVAPFITSILVDASDEVLDGVDGWEFTNAEHRLRVLDGFL